MEYGFIECYKQGMYEIIPTFDNIQWHCVISIIVATLLSNLLFNNSYIFMMHILYMLNKYILFYVSHSCNALEYVL